MERRTCFVYVLLISAGITTTAAVIRGWDQPATFNDDTNNFWPDQPGLWFTDTQEKLANELIAGLEEGSLNDIADILANPPAMKYDAVKARLTVVQNINGDSSYEWLMRLLTGMVLGDQKPSSLLQRMRNLAKYSRVDVQDETLRQMWMNKLPKNMRIALVIRESMSECTLEDLAAVADKLMEFNSIQNQLQFIQGHNMKPSELRASMQTLGIDTPDGFIHRMLIKVFPSFVGTAIAVWESIDNSSTLEILADAAERTISMKEVTDQHKSNFQELLNVEYNYGGQSPSTFLERMRSLTANMTPLHIWMYYLPEYMQEAIIVKQSMDLDGSNTIQDLTELADKLHDLK